MKLSSFRELLIKKAGDPSLQSLIKFVRNDVLADIVVESLEKMARAKHKGDAANLAIRDFGVEMDPETEPAMIHDALSHHASRYKAALQQLKDNPDNKDAKSVLNHHASKIFDIMNMAEKTQKHSHGKLRVTAPSPHAWERNIKPDQFTADSAPVRAGRKKEGQFVTDTKGWNYNGYKGNKFEFLTHPPHEHYATESKRQGHDGPYPMEHIQVNGKYLDIQDVDPKHLNEDHPFDSHPIMKHYKIPVGDRTPAHDEDYRKSYEEYQSSPKMEAFWDKMDALKEADPERHASRGSKSSAPVHHGVQPLPLQISEKPAAKIPDEAPKSQDDVAARINAIRGGQK